MTKGIPGESRDGNKGIPGKSREDTKGIPGKVREDSKGIPGKSRSEESSYYDYSNKPISDGSSCYVATAAYGTAWCHEIQVLREWREISLKNCRTGKWFLQVYDILGPVLANMVTRSAVVKTLSRLFIRTVVKILQRGSI